MLSYVHKEATMANNNEMFEVTFVSNGTTHYWNKQECEEYFGKDEWPEYEQGYLSHVIVMPLG